MLYYAQSTAVLNAVSPESSPPFHFSFTTFIYYLILPSHSLTLIPCLQLKYLLIPCLQLKYLLIPCLQLKYLFLTTTSSILHSISHSLNQFIYQHLHCFPQSLAISHLFTICFL